jgi:hypothetical protein
LGGKPLAAGRDGLPAARFPGDGGAGPLSPIGFLLDDVPDMS